MSVEPTIEVLETGRQAFLAGRIDTWFYGRTDAQPRHTLYIRILDEITQDVTRRASATQRNDPQAMQRLWLDAEMVFAPLQALGRGNHPDAAFNFWRRVDYPPEQAGERFFPLGPDDLPAIEEVTANYLSQPARSRLLDHTLVDMLIAHEVFLLANALYWRPTARGLTPHRLDAPRLTLILRTLGGALLWAFFIGGVLFLVAKGAADAGLLSEWRAGAAVLAILGVPMLITALGLRTANRHARSEVERCHALCDTMFAAYALLEPARAPADIQSAVAAAARAGAVWPAMLAPLLTDITARPPAQVE